MEILRSWKVNHLDLTEGQLKWFWVTSEQYIDELQTVGVITCRHHSQRAAGHRPWLEMWARVEEARQCQNPDPESIAGNVLYQVPGERETKMEHKTVQQGIKVGQWEIKVTGARQKQFILSSETKYCATSSETHLSQSGVICFVTVQFILKHLGQDCIVFVLSSKHSNHIVNHDMDHHRPSRWI